MLLTMNRFRLLLAVVVCVAAGGAQGRPPAHVALEIAPGIVVFSTSPYGEVGLDGNSVAVFSKDGVLVFDANGTPAAAAAVLAEIRKRTDQPVRYLVLSHWHWDHWYGAQVYKDAFPEIKIVSHEKTRAMMAGPAIAFNRPGLESGLPAYIKMLDQKLTAARATDAASPATTALSERREMARFFLEQKSSVRHTLPNVTITDRLDVTMGERRIQILSYGRAVTPGDTFIYLPAERVLVTGDLLVNPISFALSCYPTEWLDTLNTLDAIDAALIVPGHGLVLRDKSLLHATRDLFKELLRRGKEARTKGLDVDAARDAMLPELQELKTRITDGAPSVDEAFRTQLVDWYLHRVYDELAGPLTDAIAPIPQR